MLFAALQYTVYNAVRLAGNNPKMEGRSIEDFIPEWVEGVDKEEAGAADLRGKVTNIFGGMFG